MNLPFWWLLPFPVLEASLTNLSFLWLLLFPELEETLLAFVTYSGVVLGVAGLVVAVGLWRMNAWSFWATIVVCVLNHLSISPGIVQAPTTGIQVTNAVMEVVALLIIVLVVLPTSRRALASTE